MKDIYLATFERRLNKKRPNQYKDFHKNLEVIIIIRLTGLVAENSKKFKARPSDKCTLYILRTGVPLVGCNDRYSIFHRSLTILTSILDYLGVEKKDREIKVLHYK